MPHPPYLTGLHRLTPRTWTYLRPPGSWGLSNCGLVVDGDQAVLVDTAFTLGLTRQMVQAIDAQLPATTITTVVWTHGNGDHCWGTQLWPDAAIVASQATAAAMPHEISPAALTAMTRDTDPASPLGDYQRRFFGRYDFAGITPMSPTHTFTGHTTIDLPGTVVELIEVGPAHSAGDVIVHVPTEQVVFAGDVLFVGDHPVMWAGPIDNWIAACDRLLDLDADEFVPGHGPVTDRAGVARLRGYLDYVGEQATTYRQRGIPHTAAAAEIDITGYAEWGHPERLVVTIGTIYRNLGADPGPPTVLIGQMAEEYRRRRPGHVVAGQPG